MQLYTQPLHERSLTGLVKDRYALAGSFRMRGQSKRLRVVVNARRIPRAAAAPLGLANTDWIRVRGSFEVKLSDFGVRVPKMAAAKVDDKWEVKLSLFAKRVR